MRDNDKTKEQLIEELEILRRRIVELEKFAREGMYQKCRRFQ